MVEVVTHCVELSAIPPYASVYGKVGMPLTTVPSNDTSSTSTTGTPDASATNVHSNTADSSIVRFTLLRNVQLRDQKRNLGNI